VQEKSDEIGSRISGKSLVALGLWVDSGKNRIGDILQSDISQVQLNTLLNGSAFSIYRSAEPVHKSVPVVGIAASGSVPGHISGSFVPGAIIG
jgi:hypothetical protein